MKVISNEVIDRTWIEMNSMSPPELIRLVETMSKEQPSILAYLMAAGTDRLTQEEHELLIFSGVTLWRMVNNAGITLKPISVHDLTTAEETNLKMLEYLSEESETDLLRTVETLWKGYKQKGLLMFVIESLVEEEEPEEDEFIINDESLAYMFICLKTVIDCMDQTGKSDPD